MGPSPFLFLSRMLFAVFFLWYPIKFPAKSVKNLFEKFATVDMFHITHARDKAVDVAFAIGGKFISGTIAVIAYAFAGDNKARINYGANKRNTFVSGLFILLLGV